MDTVNKEMATCESCNVTMTRKHLTKHSVSDLCVFSNLYFNFYLTFSREDVTVLQENIVDEEKSKQLIYNLDYSCFFLRRTENNVLTVEKILCEFCNEQISVNDWESHLVRNYYFMCNTSMKSVICNKFQETCTSEHRRRIENLQRYIQSL